ncbi:family 16 glycosylhydrolase [Ruegeria sp. 2012CJ41-6]|uniref:Beta-glucanase n=1 Tax=Ruegeria spongiae TaxID=2942209 RepID=A0ABT0Q715_9RHOB|nr:family 16 glycosylhydrolase [Ruegeria spongiae]MCL6285635.1 family 16 glycosylhydrolase [Ruegeria spongiae]
MLNETFDQLDEAELWYVSDFTVAASWNQTAWNPDYLLTPPGEVVLTLDGTDTDGKDFTGSELQSKALYSYGSYEVDMVASGDSGVVSSFFLFSNTFFGAARHNEIDFEFLGNDTTKVNINYYYGNEKLGDNGSVQIDLGFDAADAMHTYRIDWHPDGIRWYADDVLLYEVVEETAPLPIPDEPMRIYMSVWSGGDGLQHWHGPIAPDVDTQARYSEVNFTPYVPEAPTDGSGAISFAGEDDAYVINLADGSFSQAAKVMATGDSLTVGRVDQNDPDDPEEAFDGYRMDLFDLIVEGGGWIDYVGGLQNGPADMMDRDHAAVSGVKLRTMVLNNDRSDADLSVNLSANSPDIVLLMAGTNDFNANLFTNNQLPPLLENMQKAVDQFYAYAGNASKYLVVSTLAPKVRGIPEEYASFINEGYSTVGGTPVLGDVGNGTYVPGLRALITALQAEHPTLILFDNPVGVDGLTSDDVHFSNEAYAEYAADMYNLLLTQIGQQAGTFGALAGTLPVASDVTGGNAGDRITGDGAANVIIGGGGADYLTGGAEADTFGYGSASLDGKRDYISDFSIAEGDTLDLSGVVAHYGWTLAEFQAAVRITEDVSGAELAVDTPSGLVPLVYIANISAAELANVLNVDLTDTSADADGNLAVTAPDVAISADEVTAVTFNVTGIDADATAVVEVSDGINTVTSAPLAADGSVILDLSSLADGNLTVSVTASDDDGNTAAVSGPNLILTTAGGALPTLSGTSGRDTLTDGDGATEILGLGDRDTLFGNGGNDILDGGAEVDKLYGGTGADVFRFTPDSLDGKSDVLYDLSIAEGDKIDVSQIGAFYGWDAGQTLGALTFQNIKVGTKITIATPDGTYNLATVLGLSAAELQAADILILEAGPPPDTGDDDGNLALIIPDTEIDASEVGTVQVDVTGIDADATAVVTLSAGGTDLTQNISADGTLFFDLSSLPDGPVSSSVVATDGSGNASAVSGSTLTLDTAPDLSADEDGNLAVTAPDTDITALEIGSVTFNVTGIDADATAVVEVSDGSNTVTSAPLAADGSVILDLSSLADGNLTVSVTASDDDGNTAAVNGPNLTLDSTIVVVPTLSGTSGRDTLTDGDGATEILGLGDRDTLFGNGGNDILDGGAEVDKLYGGTGADVFRFTPASLDDKSDVLYDLSIAEGDKIDVSQIGAFYGWDDTETLDALRLQNIKIGTKITVETPDGDYRIATVLDLSAAELQAGDVFIL